MMRAWIAAQRARARLTRRPVDRLEIVRSYAPGRSFLDVGCMWSVHGEVAFAAEAAGASPVCGVDVMPPTPEFSARQAGSEVRYVQGDLHDPAVLAEAGPHDVVWCSGVLYHAPNPVQTLEALRSVCTGTLLLATEILPDVPGVPGACVLYPALTDSQRRAYAAVPGGEAIGVTTPYDPDAGFGNWFWGITPSALDGLLRVAGFGPVERSWRPSPFHLTVAARPR
jgi:2-polyprenyl-3-methyl-5-hydroxy-6-metoxy-1,4-benzoquinol methylase